MLFSQKCHFQFVWLSSIDLIEKRAHITIEILKQQSVAFRHCLFGWGPLCFIIRWTGPMPPVCSSPPLIPQAYFLLHCGVLAKPDWTETQAPCEAEPPPRCVARLKMLVSVCISFRCCSVCLRIWQQNCHLLCCTCLCLWESCYSISGCCATVSVGVCVRVCMCVCGCGVLANPAPTWPNYFLLKFILIFFS